MIIPLRSGALGGAQENVMCLASGVTMKFNGGPVGAGEEKWSILLYKLHI